MAELPGPGGSKKTWWILGGLVALVVVWWLAKRGGGAQILNPQSGPTPEASQAASQGFGALASVAAAEAAAAAQLESVKAEAAAYLQGQQLQAGATSAAADRYASAQKGQYVWGTIRDIGVTLIPYLFPRGGQGSSGGKISPQFPQGGLPWSGPGGGVNIFQWG